MLKPERVLSGLADVLISQYCNMLSHDIVWIRFAFNLRVCVFWYSVRLPQKYRLLLKYLTIIRMRLDQVTLMVE